VSADANVLPYVRTKLENVVLSGPILHVWLEPPSGGLTSTNPLRVVVSLAELRYAKAEGDSHLSASGVATQQLSLDASDRSDIFVMGAGGERLEILASNATVDADAYPVTGGALVTLSSASRATLSCAGPVAGTAGGGSTLLNEGAGTCAGVVVPQGETATIQCPP
jgi:hypothetical protein